MENEYHGEALFRSNPNCVYVLEVISVGEGQGIEDNLVKRAIQRRFNREPFHRMMAVASVVTSGCDLKLDLAFTSSSLLWFSLEVPMQPLIHLFE
jgi:hypothetical protein